MSAEQRWVHLTGGNKEELVADLCSADADGGETGRGCIVIQTNATSSFHVIFSHSAELPCRGTDNPVLRFVVGKRKNSMTAVGLGNPYIKKEPIEFTRSSDALLTTDSEKSRTFWFLYDKNVEVAAMGVQAAPQADLCRLVYRFRDTVGFRAEACAGLRYIALSSGKQPVSLRVVQVCGAPDVSIPRYRFDALSWSDLPWNGSSCIFELDDAHKKIIERAQKVLADSPIASYYGFVPPQYLCLNVFRLLDPLRRSELYPGEGDDVEWSTCHAEVHRRLSPMLQSAPWTFWPLRFDRADCTSVTLAPTGPGCSKTVAEWAKAVHAAVGLRNGATGREMLSLTFAFEVFPVEGEHATQVRRDLVKEITSLVEKEWGVMEFRSPKFVCWRTHTEYEPYVDGSTA